MNHPSTSEARSVRPVHRARPPPCAFSAHMAYPPPTAGSRPRPRSRSLPGRERMAGDRVLPGARSRPDRRRSGRESSGSPFQSTATAGSARPPSTGDRSGTRFQPGPLPDLRLQHGGLQYRPAPARHPQRHQHGRDRVVAGPLGHRQADDPTTSTNASPAGSATGSSPTTRRSSATFGARRARRRSSRSPTAPMPSPTPRPMRSPRAGWSPDDTSRSSAARSLRTRSSSSSRRSRRDREASGSSSWATTTSSTTTTTARSSRRPATRSSSRERSTSRMRLRALRFHSLGYLHGHTVGGTNPSLVEAMAAGNAVVAHDNPYNRWVAGDGALYFAESRRPTTASQPCSRMRTPGAPSPGRHALAMGRNSPGSTSRASTKNCSSPHFAPGDEP